ncbi:Matrixin-domain-containing protein [Lipomyces tetrasporus]
MTTTMPAWKPPAAEDVARGSPKAQADLRAFLDRFGYLETAAEPDLPGALRKLQGFAHVHSTGKFDDETADLMRTPRCGLPDGLGLAELSAGQKRWNKETITYCFDSFSTDMAPEKAADIVSEAFDKWSAVSPLSFIQVDRDKDADIRIGWAHGEHGDGNPFDGIGKVLAHAYFPPPTGSHRFDRLAGDAHFDEAERWTTNLLESVAVHEFGHSLGLEHSDVPNSVMYPFANGVTALTAADIAAIRKVYGPRKRTS